MLGITELKLGKTIVLNSIPYKVIYNQHSKQARGGGVMKTKLKNLLSGKVLERTFQGNDKIEEAQISFRPAQFMYNSRDIYNFMDTENFENIELSAEILGQSIHFLVDGAKIDLQYWDERPINILLPPKMEFEIKETDPGVQGDRSTGGTKPATLVTGYSLRVPLFISPGDYIVVNTETGEYSERVKK